MKVINKKIKNNSGSIEILVETIEDMWHLQFILEKNDIVHALTKRKQEAITDKIRPEKLEKVNVFLGIKVNKVEFHEYSNRLRILGIIISGFDIGLSHTLNIEEKSKITIQKESWKKDQIDRIVDAVKYSESPKMIIIGIEEGDADIGIIRHYGIEMYSHIQKSSGKRFNGLRDEFFMELYNQLLLFDKDNILILICGPGFTKEDFLEYVIKKNKNIRQKIIIKDSLSIGISGFLEVLKNDELDNIIKNSRIQKEAKVIEELMVEIAKDGKASYGYTEVLKLVEMGAVEILLITDEFLRNERINKKDIDSVLKSVELLNGTISILSTRFEPGLRLQKIGGIAAILKYKMFI